MYLSQLRLSNFKCFQAPKAIKLGRLTLLTGANSSGKSSLMQAMLGLLQAEEAPFQFSTNGMYAEMGDFRDVVYGHKRKRIAMDLRFEGGDLHEWDSTWVENPHNRLPQLERLRAKGSIFELSLDKTKNGYLADYVVDFSRLKTNVQERHLASLATFMSGPLPALDEEGKRSIDAFFRSEYRGKAVHLPSLDMQQASSALVGEDGLHLPFIFTVLRQLLAAYKRRINFIGSFRLPPERTYLEKAHSQVRIQHNGEGHLDQILLWRQKSPEHFAQLVGTLRDLGLLADLRPRRLDGGRYELLVRSKPEGTEAALSDVGFGVAQFLPVLVADLQLGAGSTLFVAQPEIHLHPPVQALFADYLVKNIATQNKSYVIETHSEYLLNRIRLAIVRGELAVEDLSVLYTENSGAQSEIHPVLFGKDGTIQGAPDSFFTTYMMDVMDIALSATEQEP